MPEWIQMRGLTKSRTKPILKISAGYLMYVEPKNLPGSPVFSLTSFKTQKVILIRESYILLSHSDMKKTPFRPLIKIPLWILEAAIEKLENTIEGNFYHQWISNNIKRWWSQTDLKPSIFIRVTPPRTARISGLKS